MFALIPPHTGDVAAPLTCPGEEDGARQGPGGETDYTDTLTKLTMLCLTGGESTTQASALSLPQPLLSSRI